MSIQQQKENLINWIENINDESTLDKINTYKDLLDRSNSDWWDEIPQAHKASINKGLQEAKNEDVMSLKEFRKLYADRI